MRKTLKPQNHQDISSFGPSPGKCFCMFMNHARVMAYPMQKRGMQIASVLVQLHSRGNLFR